MVSLLRRAISGLLHVYLSPAGHAPLAWSTNEFTYLLDRSVSPPLS